MSDTEKELFNKLLHRKAVDKENVADEFEHVGLYGGTDM